MFKSSNAREKVGQRGQPKFSRGWWQHWQLLSLGLVLIGAQASQADPPPGYKMVWNDEFEGEAIDRTKWDYWQPGPRRDAINAAEAVTVADGLLVITTYTENGQHYTGMIGTSGTFESTYGYWEASMAFQDSSATWSDFWLHARTIGEPLHDMAKAGVEIDIVEHRELDVDGSPIPGWVWQALHWDGYAEHHNGTSQASPEMQLGSGFHLYGFEWTETDYRFYIDGRLTWTVQYPISRRPQFAVLSTEVEHNLWSGPIPEQGYGDRTQSRTKMQVDYVRYFVRE